MTRLIIRLLGQDVSNEIELVNGRGNPWGWSQHELHHRGQPIGWIECGKPDITRPEYSAEIVSDGA